MNSMIVLIVAFAVVQNGYVERQFLHSLFAKITLHLYFTIVVSKQSRSSKRNLKKSLTNIRTRSLSTTRRASEAPSAFAKHAANTKTPTAPITTTLNVTL